MNRIALHRKMRYQKYLNNQKKKAKSDTELNEDETVVSLEMLGKLFNDKYLVIKYLGTGTFSRVWLVYDLVSHQYRAMKLYHSRYNEDATYEIKFMSRLKNCKYVVQLYDSFMCKDLNGKDTYGLIIDLMGRSLMTIYDIYQDGMPFDAFRRLAFHTLRSMAEMHGRGLIHTDIKLENIMLTQHTGEVNEVINWFKELQPVTMLENCIQEMLPPNYSELSKDKRKQVKRRIRNKAIKQFVSILKPQIEQHVNEISTYKVNLDSQQNNYNNNETNNSQDDIDSETNEQPELSMIDFDNVQTQTDNNDDNNNNDNIGNVENTGHIHDDELDLDFKNMSAMIADFGNACLIDDIDDDDIQIRSYRPPEVVMGELYNEKADIWSLGCMFYELIAHDNLFVVEDEHNDNINEDRELLAQMYATLGKMSYEYCIDTEKTYELFDEKGRIKKHKRIDYHLLEDRLKEERSDLTEDQLNQVSSLIRGMMQYEVKNRWGAIQCLMHPIFQDLWNEIRDNLFVNAD